MQVHTHEGFCIDRSVLKPSPDYHSHHFTHRNGLALVHLDGQKEGGHADELKLPPIDPGLRGGLPLPSLLRTQVHVQEIGGNATVLARKGAVIEDLVVPRNHDRATFGVDGEGAFRERARGGGGG